MNRKKITYTLLLFCIILFFIAYALKQWWDKSPPPDNINCGIVITANANVSTDQFKGNQTVGKTQMMFGIKTYSVQDYVEVGDTVCQDGSRWTKKDTFIR
jgi:hypothetical protein